jgi:hypothetical protein
MCFPFTLRYLREITCPSTWTRRERGLCRTGGEYLRGRTIFTRISTESALSIKAVEYFCRYSKDTHKNHHNNLIKHISFSIVFLGYRLEGKSAPTAGGRFFPPTYSPHRNHFHLRRIIWYDLWASCYSLDSERWRVGPLHRGRVGA